MEDSGTLFNISVYASISSLQKLALSGFWKKMQEFIYSEYFWFLRVRVRIRALSNIDITWYPEGEWKRTYYELSNQDLRYSNLTHMRMLLEIGYDYFRTNSKDLMKIALEGNVDVLNLFLDRGWKYMPEHIIDRSIVLAATRGHDSVYSRLIAEYPDRCSGITIRSLSAAIERGRISTINLILSSQRVDLSDPRISQSIYYACENNNLEVIRELSTKIKIDSYNDKIIDALIYLCENGRTEMLQILLLSPGFDIVGMRSLMSMADARGHYDVVDLLRGYIGE